MDIIGIVAWVILALWITGVSVIYPLVGDDNPTVSDIVECIITLVVMILFSYWIFT